MTQFQSTLPVQLFYSYSHKDEVYRASMEKSLELLQQTKRLHQWDDQRILPGQQISPKIREKMDQADIIVFLFSPDFIASEECRKEWQYAETLAKKGKTPFRIPVILRECAWLDWIDNDDVKALPKDGKAVTTFDNEDIAWKDVYEGIKAVVDECRNTFSPKEDFLEEFDRTDFIFQSHIRLRDLYVFLNMTCDETQGHNQAPRETTISSQAELLENKHALIHGQECTGKTALARHLYLSLVENSKPVLFVDLKHPGGKQGEKILRHAYQEQFHGDYSLWTQQDNKTLIIDNMSHEQPWLNFVIWAEDIFDRVIVTLSSDDFYSYFNDEARLADFLQMKIEPLTQSQQEELIRKRLDQSNSERSVTDGLVDQLENHVNSIIFSKRILPRYPFFVLSILQAREAFMPTNMSITSYGHCYQALIVANLIHSGISETDVSTCFNFAEHLAFYIYEHHERRADTRFDFNAFLDKYRKSFYLSDSITNRLRSQPYSLIREDGTFRTKYMYYYFLGKFLAGNPAGIPVIEAMCQDSHRETSHLTLLFAIHHTNDNSIIDDILLRTMCTLDSVQPAILNRDETKRFGNFIKELKEDILSDDSVAKEREKERAEKDYIANEQMDTPNGTDEQEDDSPGNGIYRILKNNKIIGQVLRNKHGTLEKPKIEEIIEIIADSGLRLVNLILEDEEEISRFAFYLNKRNPDWSMHEIKQMLQFFSFLWTMVNIGLIVNEINVPEIREAVNTVVARKKTPAYDLIGYFSQLDSAEELQRTERDKLASLLKQHHDEFMKHVLSIRTQHYMNTHRSKARIEQSICSLLAIKYRFRLLPGS